MPMSELGNGWIEVFRAGDYGEKGAYTEADLDRLAASYNPALHEAPVVVGHPEIDAPAYGWVEGLRRNVDRLEAKLRQVDPGFEELVKQGRFKQRSVALYDDLGGKGLYLRHLGFLGAAPPEVKGLKSIFHDDQAKGFVEITEEDVMDVTELKRTFSEALSEFAERVGLKKSDPTPPAPTFTEAELEAAKAAAAAEAKAEAERQFSEQKSAAEKQAAKKAGVQAFINKLTPQGRWLPAFKEAGLVEFMESLDDTGTVEFGEGDKQQKQSPLQIFQAFLEALPPRIEFGERPAPQGKLPASVAAGNVAPGSLELAEAAKARAAEKKITFGEALKEVRREAKRASA